MNYLLDTHVFLRVLSDPGKLSKKAAERIRDPNNAVFVSAVSSVEIAIKQSLGKLDAPAGLETEIEMRGFHNLPPATRTGCAWAACLRTIRIRSTACSSPRLEKSR
jgi:hypothetical protein